MTETEIKAEILEGLRDEFPAIHVFRVLSGVIRTRGRVIHGAAAGTPDICGYLPDGRFLGVEVKTPKKGTVSQEQLDFAVRATRAGAVVFGASSWQECREKLARATEGKP